MGVISHERRWRRADGVEQHRAGLTTRPDWLRVAAMATVVVVLNVVGWSLLRGRGRHRVHLSQTKLFGLGTGVLAYTLGVRHAFDADHIAAIDNTTRKLVGEGKRPLGVGFFFSLGHSSVVLVLALALNLGIRALDLQVSHHRRDSTRRPTSWGRRSRVVSCT